MNKIIRFCVFSLLLAIISAVVVFADNTDAGWKGYGLYNFNRAGIVIDYESVNVIINGDNASAVYEYTIKCNSDKNTVVNFGYPDNGITKFTVNDGNKFINYKTRNKLYLKNNYKAENIQVSEDLWFLFNMTFSPGQTQKIKVTIESRIKKDNNDTYPLSFFNDRNYPYVVSGDNISLAIVLDNFRPYNVIELIGLNQEDISDKGEIRISYDNGYGRGISIRYQPVDKMVLDKLNTSPYKKPKAIARAFSEGNYNEALKLCNEYISAPADSSLNIEQLEYIKAECLRLLNNIGDYLNIVDNLDTTMLYPSRIRYKILIDKMEIYNAAGDNDSINKILKQLIPEIRQSYPYLNSWMKNNGYEIRETEQEPQAAAHRTDNPVKSPKGFDVLGALISFITTARESRWLYVIVGFLIGFIAGRKVKRKKKERSVYLFRD